MNPVAVCSADDIAAVLITVDLDEPLSNSMDFEGDFDYEPESFTSENLELLDYYNDSNTELVFSAVAPIVLCDQCELVISVHQDFQLLDGDCDCEGTDVVVENSCVRNGDQISVTISEDLAAGVSFSISISTVVTPRVADEYQGFSVQLLDSDRNVMIEEKEGGYSFQILLTQIESIVIDFQEVSDTDRKYIFSFEDIHIESGDSVSIASTDFENCDISSLNTNELDVSNQIFANQEVSFTVDSDFDGVAEFSVECQVITEQTTFTITITDSSGEEIFAGNQEFDYEEPEVIKIEPTTENIEGEDYAKVTLEGTIDLRQELISKIEINVGESIDLKEAIYELTLEGFTNPETTTIDSETLEITFTEIDSDFSISFKFPSQSLSSKSFTVETFTSTGSILDTLSIDIDPAIICTEPCGSCLSETPSDCLSCSSPYFLLDKSEFELSESSCIIACPNGEANSECIACATETPYLACNSDPETADPDSLICECVACPEYCATCSTSGECEECESGFGFADQFCEPCNDACEECTTTDHCTSCNQSNGPSYLDPLLFECNTDCPVSFFIDPDALTPTCAQCPDGCSACESLTSCTSCSEGKWAQGTECVDECDGGFIPFTGLERYCLECHLACISCSGDPASCDICKSGYFLIHDGCQTICPIDYITNLEAGTCTEPIIPDGTERNNLNRTTLIYLLLLILFS
jgi:hypothetical protein